MTKSEKELEKIHEDEASGNQSSEYDEDADAVSDQTNFNNESGSIFACEEWPLDKPGNSAYVSSYSRNKLSLETVDSVNQMDEFNKPPRSNVEIHYTTYIEPVCTNQPDDDVSGCWSDRFKLQKFFHARKVCYGKVLEIDKLYLNFTNTYDLKSNKAISKREKRERKKLTMKIRARRKIELAAKAKKEAKERRLSDSIELFLQMLRMITSFATLTYNIRKTFIPAQFKYLKPDQNAYDNSELLLFFRFTVFLDVLLFWISFLRTNCLQCHLCCRLGLVKFLLWSILLSIIGGSFMFIPMLYVQKNLDISWCRFIPNSSLVNYQPSW